MWNVRTAISQVVVGTVEALTDLAYCPGGRGGGSGLRAARCLHSGALLSPSHMDLERQFSIAAVFFLQKIINNMARYISV